MRLTRLLCVTTLHNSEDWHLSRTNGLRGSRRRMPRKSAPDGLLVIILGTPPGTLHGWPLALPKLPGMLT